MQVEKNVESLLDNVAPDAIKKVLSFISKV